MQMSAPVRACRMWSRPSRSAEPGATISSAFTSRGSWRCWRSETSSPASRIGVHYTARASPIWVYFGSGAGFLRGGGGGSAHPEADLVWAAATVPADPQLAVSCAVDRPAPGDVGAHRERPPQRELPAGGAADAKPAGPVAAGRAPEAPALSEPAAALPAVPLHPAGDGHPDLLEGRAALVAGASAQRQPAARGGARGVRPAEAAERRQPVDAPSRRARLGPPGIRLPCGRTPGGGAGRAGTGSAPRDRRGRPR